MIGRIPQRLLGAKIKSFIQSKQHTQVTTATYSGNGSNLTE